MNKAKVSLEDCRKKCQEEVEAESQSTDQSLNGRDGHRSVMQKLFSRCMLQLGEVYYHCRQYKDAEKILKDCLNSRNQKQSMGRRGDMEVEETVQVHFWLSRVYEALGEDKQAKECFDECVQTNKNNAVSMSVPVVVSISELFERYSIDSLPLQWRKQVPLSNMTTSKWLTLKY
jgi:tetratricopeptide (TPR) repeat protein